MEEMEKRAHISPAGGATAHVLRPYVPRCPGKAARPSSCCCCCVARPLRAQGSGFSSPRRAAISADARSMPARSLAACAAASSLAVSVSACDNSYVLVAEQAIQTSGLIRLFASLSIHQQQHLRSSIRIWCPTHIDTSRLAWQRQRQGQQQLLIGCRTASCSARANDACYGVE